MTDNLTGLMWLKDANCFGSMNWQEALDKVAYLNDNPGSYSCGGYTAGYTDWTLPNINELESLYNSGVPNSATWLNVQGFVNVQSNDYYWSSTTYAGLTDQAWIVGMANGEVYGIVESYRYGKKSYENYVWPVRAATTSPRAIWKTGQTHSYAAGDDGDLQRGVAWPYPRFTDNGDGTVTDNLSGLMWLKDTNCFGEITWQEALDKVADLNVNPGSYSCEGYTAGYTDWRLPNRKELHSLTDASQERLVLPQGHPFLNAQFDYYWSSTTCAADGMVAWFVHMGYGNVVPGYKPGNTYMWPVRAGHSGSLVHLDIRANGSDGPITVSPSTPIAIKISLNSGAKMGDAADFWIAVHTPFNPPGNWYSYGLSGVWMPGLHMCAQMALFDFTGFQLLNGVLPSGSYTFYFGVNDPIQSIFSPWWGMDSVEVNVL